MEYAPGTFSAVLIRESESMSYIIVSRNPRANKLVIVTDGDDDVPAEFKTEEEAIEAAHNTTICKAWSYQILEVQ